MGQPSPGGRAARADRQRLQPHVLVEHHEVGPARRDAPAPGAASATSATTVAATSPQRVIVSPLKPGSVCQLPPGCVLKRQRRADPKIHPPPGLSVSYPCAFQRDRGNYDWMKPVPLTAASTFAAVQPVSNGVGAIALPR